MFDNRFQFNWRGMTREPQRQYAIPRDGDAQARAAYIALQSANMQGYNPLPDMSVYRPTIVGREADPYSNPLAQPEISMFESEQEKRPLMEKLEANEQRIEELKQEYLSLQQENETTTEDLERNVAANRAGIGDSSQYNAWRARVDARETQKNAMQADSESVMREANKKLDNALRDLSYARGDKETAIAKDMYKDALAEYNEKARKLGLPEKKANEMYNAATVTMFDTKDFIRQHRNAKGQWDSEENKQKAYNMAKALGDEGVPLLDEIYGQTTKEKADAKRNRNTQAVKTAAATLKGKASGDYSIDVNGTAVPAKVQNSSDGKSKEVVVGGKIVYTWKIEE